MSSSRRILLPEDDLLLRPGEGDGLHLRECGDVITQQEVIQCGRIDVHGVLVHQVHGAVSEGEIALAVQLAEAPHPDLIVRVPGGEADGTHRVLQAVLGGVRHVLDDKGRPELREPVQQLPDLFAVHRERLVPVIDPAVPVCAEGQGDLFARLVRIGPRHGGHLVGRQLKDHLSALPDVLPRLF